MKISYRGIARQLPPQLQKKVDVKFGKLSKLLEKRGEKEAHVVLTTERHLHHAEITLQFYDHQLVGEGSDTDPYSAMIVALDKLEKQAVNQRGKWREKARRHNGAGLKQGDESQGEVRRDKTAGGEAAQVKTGHVTIGHVKIGLGKTGPGKAAKAEPGAAAAHGRRVFRVNHLNGRKPMTLDEAIMEMENGCGYIVYRDADRECVSVLVRRQDGDFDLIES